MKLIIDPEITVFGVHIPRGVLAQRVVDSCHLLGNKPNIRDRMSSGRTFNDAQMVCAEIEFDDSEEKTYDWIGSAAEAQGWSVADSLETAAFVLDIPAQFTNSMPESLIANITASDALHFERFGWNAQARFSLTVSTLVFFRTPPSVLLIKEIQPR